MGSVAVSETISKDNRSVADAQAQSATENAQVTKDNATNQRTSIDGSTVILQQGSSIKFDNTDYGAIAAAFKFASDSNSKQNQTVQDVLNVSKDTFDKTTSELGKAYEDARGGAFILQNVTIGMMITIAAVAYFWLGKGK